MTSTGETESSNEIRMRSDYHSSTITLLAVSYALLVPLIILLIVIKENITVSDSLFIAGVVGIFGILIVICIHGLRSLRSTRVDDTHIHQRVLFERRVHVALEDVIRARITRWSFKFMEPTFRLYTHDRKIEIPVEGLEDPAQLCLRLLERCPLENREEFEADARRRRLILTESA